MIKNVLLTIFILTLSFLSYGEEVAIPTDTTATIEATVNTTTTGGAAMNAEVLPQTTSLTATSTAKMSETAKLAEDQIPLLIATDKKTVEAGSATTKAMATGVIVLALLGASYYYVRKYKTSNTINKSNMQIKVLTQHYLGPKKSLAIIHVAGESILLGITDTNISMIKSLSLIDDEVPVEMPKTFAESLAKKTAMTTKEVMADELDEEFSFSSVTDTVSKKIKSMRSFS